MLNFPQIAIRTKHGRLLLTMDGTVVKNSGGEPVQIDKDLKLLTIGPSVVEPHPSEGSNTWRILNAMQHASERGARLVMFPSRRDYYQTKARIGRLGKCFPLRANGWPEPRTCAYLYPER